MNWKNQVSGSVQTFAPMMAGQPVEGPTPTELRCAADLFRKQQVEKPWSDFLVGKDVTCMDLADKLERFGAYASPKQADYARKLVGWATPAPRPTAAPEAPVVESLPAFPAVAALFAPDRFSRFSVGLLALARSNDGDVVWVKWQGKLVGMLSPGSGTFRWKRFLPLSPALKQDVLALLAHVEQDPQGAAATDGLLTGRCSCCGRELTDPTSIALGIGPVCIGKFA